MATITIVFDPNDLPAGVAASITITADPAEVTLPVKNDSVPYFTHPATGNFHIVLNVITALGSGKALDVVFPPFDSTHPAVTEKPYIVRSSPLPHEDFLSWVQIGGNLAAHIKTPSVVDKTTSYFMSTNAPPFLTVRVRRQ